MMHEVQPQKTERSLGELLADLTQELTTLVRQELNLFKTEMSQKAKRAGRDVAFVVAGGAIAYAGLLALVAAFICLLALAMPWWAAALIVGLLVAGAGGALVWKGLNDLKQADLVPHETLDTLKEEKSGIHTTRDRGVLPG